MKYIRNFKKTAPLTCARLRTGWSAGAVVDDSDGEAVREGIGVILGESSDWLGSDDWQAAREGDTHRLPCNVFWPETYYSYTLHTIMRYSNILHMQISQNFTHHGQLVTQSTHHSMTV